MSVKLEDYREILEQISPEVHNTLEASFAEAAHFMSPSGLRNYLEGARALTELGRGTDVVLSYLQEMPVVVKEVGEDVIGDVVGAAFKLSSMTSGAVISLLFSTLSIAARRLGDAKLLRDYLAFVHQLSAKAARGLRPMLNRLDILLGQLTLGGLRRWALWGAQAHIRDFNALQAYFDLQSADSQAVLQQERRGTLFVDTHRRLNFYLRAFWGRDFFLRPTAGDFETREGLRPYIEHNIIHVPDAYDNFNAVAGTEIYRATVAHAAAHIMYTRTRLSAEALTPIQMLFIALFEDARVETIAIGEFPGLRKLWLNLLPTEKKDDVVGLIERMARGMLDPDYQDNNAWVQAAVTAFRARAETDLENNQMSWDLGVEFYNKLGTTQAIPNAYQLEKRFSIPYRDDNRFIWAFQDNEWEQEIDYLAASRHQIRKKVSVMEMVDELDCELAGDDAQEIWVLDSEFFRDGDPPGVSINQLEGKEPVSEPYHYPEWDYQIQLSRPDWATVLEKRMPKGDATIITQVLDEYKPLASRIRHIIDAMQPQGVIRLRHQEEGDEIDLDAAIRAMVDIRMGYMPDHRINIRHIRKTRDLAVLVLLDLSESTNETLGDSEKPVIQLAREATALLSWAIDGIGDPFAIHGFASDGRHDVQYFRFKDFEQPYDDNAKARLAGMYGGLSTRMGAALRHAGQYLNKRPQRKKLLLLVSDGEPADIDVRDPRYLRADTKKAVDELSRKGVTTYCLTLDPHADDYVSRIFGINGYTIVDHVQRLPEKLPALFMGLTK
ncbi:MAG: VWA domain-containing protein [Candidatus Parabeggiatoa sp. nov. 2]|nr:MAG: VWA domain-containing protein [Beggiatoa sp. 4572_84]RKZ59414.1 MAG: VWA domain-containing protein [Gammaproteobacteria bacterium]